MSFVVPEHVEIVDDFLDNVGSNDGETEDPPCGEPGRDRHAYHQNRKVSDTLFGLLRLLPHPMIADGSDLDR